MNNIILLLIASSIIGLILIYFSASMITPKFLSMDEIDPSMIGSAVATGGIIISAEKNKGHLFLEIEDEGRKLSIPIFSDLLEKIPEQKVELLKKGELLFVSGYLDEYRGRMQIVPRKSEDLHVDGE